MHNEIVNLGCFVEITSTRLLRQMASPRPSKKMKLEDIPPALVSLYMPDSNDGGCDVVIIVQGKRFEAHKRILSAASPVFKVMLTSGMQESVSKEIVLKSVKANSFQLILKFMYTGQIKIDQEECCLDILHFAHQYEMNLLLNIAEIRLIEYTTTASEKIVIERLFLADELLLKDLANASEKRIGQHFLKFHGTHEFQYLPFPIVNQILKSDYILRVSELDVVQAIIGWATNSVSKQGSNTQRYCPWRLLEARHLLQHVNIEAMKVCEMKLLSQLPGVRLFPDLLTDLLSKGNFNGGIDDEYTRLVRKRYEARLIPKRLTIVFEIRANELNGVGYMHNHTFNARSNLSRGLHQLPLYSCSD